MGNPFYVRPLGGVDLATPLSGLGNVLKTNREEKQRQAQMQEAQEAIRTAIQSGDPQQIAEVSIQYPQFREVIESTMNIAQEGQRNDLKSFSESILANPGNARETTLNRLQMLQSQGRDTTQTEAFLQEVTQNPEMAIQNVERLYALQNPESYNAFLKTREGSASTPAFQTLAQRAEAAGLIEGTLEYQNFMRYGGAAPPGGSDQRERKIDQYQKRFGMSLEEATRAVDSRTMLDDKGNLITFDPTTGQGTLLEVETGTERPVLQPPEGVAIEDLAFDPGEGTGFGASFLGLWNSTLGQLPLVPIFEGPEMAAQNLRVVERDAVRALASSSRPPVIEQARIMSLIPGAMEWTQNPEVANFKMTNFVDLMMNQYVDDRRFMEDRTNPKRVREESARRANEIESIVRRVLLPEAADAMFQSLNKMESELGEVRSMSDAQLRRVDPSSLTPAQLDLYIERLQGITSGN